MNRDRPTEPRCAWPAVSVGAALAVTTLEEQAISANTLSPPRRPIQRVMPGSSILIGHLVPACLNARARDLLKSCVAMAADERVHGL
jgi:hypothetical protein